MDCVVNIDGASKAYKKEKIDYIALQRMLLKTKELPSNLTILNCGVKRQNLHTVGTVSYPTAETTQPMESRTGTGLQSVV